MSFNNQSITTIAIIGGGAAGTSLCLQIARTINSAHAAPKVRILLFEQAAEAGPGLPYGFLEESFCINLPKQYMTLTPGHYEHFATWHSSVTQQCSLFPPRHYFGEYAKEQLASLNNSPRYELLIQTAHEVMNITLLHSNRYQIQTIHQQIPLYYEADYVILATGHLPSTSFSHLEFHSVMSPWDMKRYANIHPQAHVGVVGSRLTAIDVTLKLLKQQHRGKISLVSRSGLLSSVRSEHAPPEMRYLIPKNIQHLLNHESSLSLVPALVHLLEQEMSSYLGPAANLWRMIKEIKNELPHARLQREIRQAELKQSRWQSVLSCFYQILFRIWPKVHPSVQQHFITQYSSLLITMLCSFPLEKAYLLEKKFAQGQLTLHKGLSTIENNSNHFVLYKKQEKPMSCDVLILASGSGANPEAVPLLANMLQQKLISKHALGGLSVHQSTYQIVNKQQDSSRIYSLGDLVKGACFNTVELGQIVEQAQLITQHLVQRISQNSAV